MEPKTEWDAGFLRARREAAVVLCLLAAALAYTVLFCYRFGYQRDVETITTYWGIPDWVCWGVILPWVLCFLFTTWFCFSMMKDDPTEESPHFEESGEDSPHVS